MGNGKPKHSVIALPRVCVGEMAARLLVQPAVPDDKMKELKHEVRANECYREDAVSIFRVPYTGSALEEARQALYDAINGKPDVVYAVQMQVTDYGVCDDSEDGVPRFPVIVYLSPEGENETPEQLLARAKDAFPDDAEVFIDPDDVKIRTFYSYGA